MVLNVVFYRVRKSRGNGCQCGEGKEEGSKAGSLELSEHAGQMVTRQIQQREVYDNPNYSHIMIGGQPFFILPSGELSEHVPVPRVTETVRVVRQGGEPGREQHIYTETAAEGGSSYRSTSDYDTDSSTYRPDSDRASTGPAQQPIYEEIDREAEERAAGSGYQAGARTLHLAGPLPQAALHHGAAKLHPGWTGNKSLSPRRPPPSSNSSIYYYADTLRRGMGEVAESDSGVSSENTPQHRGRGAGPGPWLHRPAPAQPRPPSDPSQERANRSDQSSFVQTQVFLTNVPSKQKIVKL